MKGTRATISDALAIAYMGNTQIAGYLAYLCRIDKSDVDQSSLMARAVQLAKVRAAVSEQPEPINLWLQYSYGPDVEAMNKPKKQAMIASQIASDAFQGNRIHKRANRLAAIAYMAVEDYRMGLLMGKEMPVSQYLEFAGIPEGNWYRDWQPHRRTALMKLKSWDDNGVARVSMVVRAIREAEACK